MAAGTTRGCRDLARTFAGVKMRISYAISTLFLTLLPRCYAFQAGIQQISLVPTNHPWPRGGPDCCCAKPLTLKNARVLGSYPYQQKMAADDVDQGVSAIPKPSAVKVSFPSPGEGAEMGIREWPGFLKKDRDFDEEAEAGALRYVLEGNGTCTPQGESSIDMEPGTLLECIDPVKLSWQVSEPMVILTPKFEQPGILAAGFLAVFGGLGWLLANANDSKAVKKRNQS